MNVIGPDGYDLLLDSAAIALAVVVGVMFGYDLETKVTSWWRKRKARR